MRQLISRVTIVVGTLAIISAGSSFFVIGCSGDDTSGPATGDSGIDGTVDGALDALNDRGQAGDVIGSDAQDSAPDATPDADAGPDALPDAPALADFGPQIDRVLCQRLSECCLLSASAFNSAGCLSDQEVGGGVFGITGSVAPIVDAGTVNYDKQKAASCLSAVSTIPCGIITGTILHSIRDQCFAAVQGKVAVDGGCQRSLECATGEFCNADSGTCAAVLPLGSSCNSANDEQCSYLGHASNGEYCNPNTNTCAASQPLDAGCNTYRECASQLCTGNCVNSYIFSDPGVPQGTCDYYTIRDAGGGG